MAYSEKELTDLELKLLDYAGEDRVVPSTELIAEFDNTPTVVIKTNMPTMDRILNGVEGGELIVVTGPTGGGKTTLLMTITAKMDAKSVWFSLEVTPRQFVKKLGEHPPLFYTPARTPENSVKWLVERIIEAKMKYDIKIVFIDHLHQIFAIDRFNGTNLSLELGDVVAKIKQIAIEYDLVIFLVAHNTDDKTRTNREPKMMDVRDSGMVTRLADTVMGVWRIPNEYNGTENTMPDIAEGDEKAKVRIWKNRREGTLGYFIARHLDHQLMEIDVKREEQKLEDDFNSL